MIKEKVGKFFDNVLFWGYYVYCNIFMILWIYYFYKIWATVGQDALDKFMMSKDTISVFFLYAICYRWKASREKAKELEKQIQLNSLKEKYFE